MTPAHTADCTLDINSLRAADLITLAKAAQLSGIRHECLRIFVRRGRIKAVKIGSEWMTTPAALAEYLNTPRKRGRPARLEKEA